MTYSAKIIKGGKIVIPAELRRELGFAEGDRVYLERREDGGIIVRSHADVIRDLQRAVRESITKPFTVDDFIAEKRAEAARE
ncbi:MAG: AbrB family transcriptional regulator [Blastomonas sp. CACIA14H2]|uniref:AbrB/MazE/SpoVT family DNA-binding domain-containing protein n=1 Tax=Blastomonas sp. CACIA14H2 TaxID=1419876 RepID=UPI0003CFBEAC|nr:MAG: AbrB family transcriptional regulator [Blastomonas sp. CACIA14H2]